MEPATLPDAPWFSRTELAPGLTRFTEPYLNEVFRANFYHIEGRDLDLLVDTGMGLAPVAPQVALAPGKKLLAVATHIHADHVGSMHEFANRAGPREDAAAFATMPDRLTFADEFREMPRPVSALPHPAWRVRDYVIPGAPLTLILDEGDAIDLGDRRFQVLELPGHCYSQIGLFDEADGTLFSGDAIHAGRLYDSMWCSDVVAYRRTMRRLIDLPVRVVHGGHGPSLDRQAMVGIAHRYLERTGGP